MISCQQLQPLFPLPGVFDFFFFFDIPTAATLTVLWEIWFLFHFCFLSKESSAWIFVGDDLKSTEIGSPKSRRSCLERLLDFLISKCRQDFLDTWQLLLDTVVKAPEAPMLAQRA